MNLPALQNSGSGISVTPIKVRSAAEIEQAMNQYAGQTDVGLVIPPSSIMAVNRNVILAGAAKLGLPAIYPNRRFVADGGLVSYGIDRIEQYRRVASYVSRILKGAAPADLPVQQSEKFELVINLKVAKTLGLNVPRIMLARADEVIE